MSISSLHVGPECVSCHAMNCTGHEKKFKTKTKKHEGGSSIIEKQSEIGYVCTWIFFLGQRRFLCKWRAAKSDPLSLPPEGLGYGIFIPGPLPIHRTLEKLSQTLPKRPPLQHSLLASSLFPGAVVGRGVTSVGQPKQGWQGENCSCSSAEKLWELLLELPVVQPGAVLFPKPLSAWAGRCGWEHLGFSTPVTLWRAFCVCRIMVGEHWSSLHTFGEQVLLGVTSVRAVS